MRRALALAAVLLALAAWHCTESDIQEACGDSQACLAASL